MGNLVNNSYFTPLAIRQTIANRYHVITRAINMEFWGSSSDTAHSFYVGSYGRGTSIDTSDIDILVELPRTIYDRFSSITGNGQSRLLQAIRKAIQISYPKSDVRSDGQVVKINFHDNIKFEILPAFTNVDSWGNQTDGYTYPNSSMGGNWQSTFPKAEQKAMKSKNNDSNGLLFATCKHLRFIRDTYYSSYHLSGIVIDSFVYAAIGNWRFTSTENGSASQTGSYENVLLKYFNDSTYQGLLNLNLKAPGSNQTIDASDSLVCLKKVLTKTVA